MIGVPSAEWEIAFVSNLGLLAQFRAKGLGYSKAVMIFTDVVFAHSTLPPLPFNVGKPKIP